MYHFISHLFKLLLLISQASSFIFFVSCSFLIMEHIIDILFEKLRFSSIENTTSYHYFFEMNIHYGGGNISQIISPALHKSQLIHYDKCGPLNPLSRYRFVKYVLNIKLAKCYVNRNCYVLCKFTLSEVSNWLTVPDTLIFAKKHNISLPLSINHMQLAEALVEHVCDSCFYHACIFEEIEKKNSICAEKKKRKN